MVARRLQCNFWIVVRLLRYQLCCRKHTLSMVRHKRVSWLYTRKKDMVLPAASSKVPFLPGAALQTGHNEEGSEDRNLTACMSTSSSWCILLDYLQAEAAGGVCVYVCVRESCPWPNHYHLEGLLSFIASTNLKIILISIPTYPSVVRLRRRPKNRPHNL